MLALSMITLAMIIAAFGIGSQFLQVVDNNTAREAGDQFFIAVWIGLLLMGGVLTASALLVPIGAVAFGVTLTAGAAACAASQKQAVQVLDALSFHTSRLLPILCLVVVSLAAALLASKDVSHFDTGLYQLPQMLWLEQSGLVHGLGLLSHRFGYNSIWLALAAPIVDFGTDYRFVTFGGAVIYTLLAFQGIYSAARIAAFQARPADWYFLGALIPALTYRDIISLVVSSSPDFPVYALAVIFGWTFLIDDERRHAATAMMLATGAVAIKLSAAPLLASAAVYLIWGSRAFRPNVFAILSFAVPTLGSVLAANFITSGCLAFPAAITCFSVPWGIPSETARAVSLYISQWPLQGNINPFSADDIREYASGHLRIFSVGERLSLLHITRAEQIILLATTACAGAGVLFWNRRTPGLFLIGTALLGLAFSLMAPSYRFNVDYVGILFGTATVSLTLADRILWSAPRLFRQIVAWASAGRVMIFGSAVTLLFAFALANVSKIGDRELAESGFAGRPTPLLRRVLLPPPVVARELNLAKGTISETSIPLSEPLQLVETRDHDVVFVWPKLGEQCWSARLPCIPNGEPFNPVQLRNPTRGLSTGFVLSP